ncbi:ATP-binding protein, partial [Clostridium perfringens]
ILADADQLSAALWAVLQNAAEAMIDAAVPAPAARLAATTTVDAVAFTIANRGPAITPELAETIFHPFMTTKPEGSGVGL